jgi:hypothetical protein
MTLTSWQPRKRRNGTIGAYGGEYVTMWYVGQIPEDMVRDPIPPFFLLHLTQQKDAR